MSLADDLYAHTVNVDGCWVWQRATTEAGYGLVWLDGRLVYVHRLSYERSFGPIPDGLCLDHLCRNRACCNQAHLEPVTTRINSLRGNTRTARNAAVTHCPQNHPYNDQNTYITRRGTRACRSCAREYQARKRATASATGVFA